LGWARWPEFKTEQSAGRALVAVRVPNVPLGAPAVGHVGHRRADVDRIGDGAVLERRTRGLIRRGDDDVVGVVEVHGP
jgi:hypothetical protein